MLVPRHLNYILEHCLHTQIPSTRIESMANEVHKHTGQNFAVGFLEGSATALTGKNRGRPTAYRFKQWWSEQKCIDTGAYSEAANSY